MDALGMQSGRIKADAIQASSSWNNNHSPDQGRLHFQKSGYKVGAWCAKTNDANQWIQAKFDVVAKVRRVATQGRTDSEQWVKTYTLAYSFDGKDWKDYELNGKVTVSEGLDQINQVETPRAIIARQTPPNEFWIFFLFTVIK